ncbi:MAG: tetratricopeptide repeat protein [Chloroflexota bacterium]
MNDENALVDFDTLWNYGEPANTEQAFRELLPLAEESGDREYHVQLLTQIGRTLGLQRRFDEAYAILDQAESLLSPDLPVASVRYLLERGRTYNSSGRKEEAADLFQKAYDLAAKKQNVMADSDSNIDFYAVDALHMLAIATDVSEEQIGWNEQAIAYAEQSSQPKARNWLGSLLNNLGWTYHDMGAYEKALRLFEKALAFRQEQGNPENIQIAKWCVARVLRSLGRVEEAYQAQLALAAESDSASGYTNEEIGECLLLLQRPDEARPYFAQAYAQLSQDIWLTANESERLERLKCLGEGV